MGDGDPLVLHFEDSGEWCSLPQWAEYFISIGKRLALAPPTENRLTTAIIVPTRAYGAAFVSLGIVIGEASQADQPSAAAHFEQLFDLPPGSPVLYRPSKGKVLRGILLSPVEERGELWIRVQVHSREGGGLTYLVKEKYALTVQPSGGKPRKLPKKQGSAGVRSINSFVDQILGEADPVQLGLRSKVVCALVGRRNVLHDEISRTPFSIRLNGERYASGELQDILRVDSFVTPQQSHRTALVSSAASKPPVEPVGVGVVFDGGAGFLRLGSSWRSKHQVVVLDRTEPYFDDAIQAINSRFTQCSKRTDGIIPDGDAPPGAELLSFGESIQ